MIVGLTGSLAAGKGAVADFLKQKGFEYYSFSDVLRDELDALGIEKTRDNLIAKGNELRVLHGPGILARKLLEKIKTNKAVVDGIRNPAEIEELRQRPDFYLVAVDAPDKVRFNRIAERGREKDPTTLAEFKKLDKIDKGLGQDESGQQVGKCLKMADMVVVNASSLETLYKKCAKVMDDIESKELNRNRPDWDSYFLKAAMLAGERSTCRRHHVGAVIVKNRRILATGYNGAAAGAKDCLEKGCLRNELGIPSGTRHEICRAIHAEQNAIIQAGIHGVSIEGGVMYCTHSPCIICAKMIANAKIKKVVTCSDYSDPTFVELFKELGIEYIKKSIPKKDIYWLP